MGRLASTGYYGGEPLSLEAALRLVDGDRQASYGDPVQHMHNVAKCWSAILGYQITPKQCALALAGLKLVREGNKHDPDNLTDAIGYIVIAERVEAAGHFVRPSERGAGACTDPA